VTEKLVEIKEKVDAESLLSPIANAGLLLELDGSDLSVTTKTKFFQEATGEFYLGVYFVENEIIAFQASQGNNAVHEKILRGSISNGSFGELLGNGTIETGTEFDHNFSASILDMNVDHLEVITILWKKEGDTYMVINTNISTDFQQTSSTENALEQSITFEVIPNVVHEMSNISISSQNSIKRAKISLVTASGRHIETIYAGSLLAGNSNFSFHKTTSLASGVYYITLESEEGILTRSVMIK
jgi:hypothetical protein